LLARGDRCAIGRCRHCGSILLGIGRQVRLRISEDTLFDLVEALSAAAQRLDACPADQATGADADAPGDPERAYRH
jgi:hypothetical protein